MYFLFRKSISSSRENISYFTKAVSIVKRYFKMFPVSVGYFLFWKYASGSSKIPHFTVGKIFSVLEKYFQFLQNCLFSFLERCFRFWKSICDPGKIFPVLEIVLNISVSQQNGRIYPYVCSLHVLPIPTMISAHVRIPPNGLTISLYVRICQPLNFCRMIEFCWRSTL